jgi:hypothetical protein
MRSRDHGQQERPPRNTTDGAQYQLMARSTSSTSSRDNTHHPTSQEQ